MQNDFYPPQPESVDDLPLFSGIPLEVPASPKTAQEKLRASIKSQNSENTDIKRKWVYDSFKAPGPEGATDIDISRFINLPAEQICLLRNELIRQGVMAPVMEGLFKKKRKDQITGIYGILWRVT